MKKRALITLLALTMTAAMITGCGNKPSQDQAAETTQESTVESSEESTDAAPDESEPGSDAEPTTESTEDGAEQTSSEEPSEAQAEESQEPSQEASQGNESASNESESAAESGPAAQAETTPEVTPVTTEAQAPAEQPQAPEYDVTAISATMYVKNTVNLRQGPGSSYAKVGSLNKGEQVTVTGQAANGWYQLDSGAFVSNKYLDSTAPAATTATVPGTTVLPTDQTGVVTPVDTLATVDPYVAPATEFFDYLNQQRSAAGLCTLTWDSDMAAVAQRRAKELATDFSHNGNVERYNENIHTTNNMSSTYVDWYNSFYNSTAHRETMMNPNIGRGSAALYFDGFNNYYVVCNFEGNPLSAEELLEQFNPDNMVQIGENTYIGKDDYNAMIEAGIDPSAQPDEEANKKMDEQNKLIDEGVMDEIWLN